MSMLFRNRDVDERVPEETETQQPSAFRADVTPVFSLGNRHKSLSEVFGEIQKNKAYHVPSLGSWSMHDLLAYCLQQTGSADVYVMTWSIKNKAVQTILQLKDEGLIQELKCIFDGRVKTTCPDAWQLADANLQVRLTKNHSKITVIKNDHYSIVVVGSANMTHNPRIEAYVLTESADLAAYYINIINQLFEGSKPFHNDE